MATKDFTKLPRSRREARLSGALQYFTENQCPHGHIFPRWTTSGGCIECARLKAPGVVKRYRAGLPLEELRARRAKERREWRRRDPERARDYDQRMNARKDKAKRNKWQRDRRVNNPDVVHETENTYRTTRRAEDSNYKLRGNLRTRLNRAIKAEFKAGSAVRDLGCTIEEFKAHIESQFLPSMTWENWGVGPGKWHLDHVRELADFDLRVREEFLAAAHWSNYRPLWSEENCGRSARFGRGILGRSRQPQAPELPL